ncbi:MAG TPA: DUF2071 domain-containing protein [Solirubrobacteraceae bacterium]|nr:DUF2071 domain-containing protein [Solirubrobacteraceae bacterium]
MRCLVDGLDLLASPLAHERVTRERAHRPWPLPARSWTMAQTWTDLLFAHWSVAPELLRGVVASPLALDTFDGRAWIGVTPFRVRNLRLRPTLPVPLVSAFGEINVRTYVTVDGKPGIYFFSLDADSALAVAAARRAYRLPYFRARMSIARDAGEVRFASHRTSREAPARADFRAHYGPVGKAFPATAGSLEQWLTERYCLYTFDDRRRVLRADIHHPPWPLQAADADIAVNTMTAEIGVELAGEPLLHFARRQDVVFWTLAPCE